MSEKDEVTRSEKDEVTRTVQVLDILPGDPLRIVTGEWLHKHGKRVKFFQQMVPILNAALSERFTAQVRKGDTVQVTVVTEWHDKGYNTYLEDFAALSQSVPDALEAAVR